MAVSQAVFSACQARMSVAQFFISRLPFEVAPAVMATSEASQFPGLGCAPFRL